MESFIEYQQKALPLESYWRSIVLFGKNTASYKFSLGKALLEMASLQNNKVSLQDLAPVFARYICSSSIARANSWVNVISDMDRILSARSFTAPDNP